MQSSYPPRPPYPPPPGPAGESDRNLVARLSGPGAARHHAVALLLARHWRATRDYAVVCLAAAGPTAQLVATAAFHTVLGRTAGGAVGGALRPQLLAAARDTVRAWAGDDAACVTLPELRKTAGGRGLRATKPGTPERRQLADRAFRALPGASQCLLWHTEVEAEPINIPAGLLGVDPVTATHALDQAREQFRTGCVRAHRELAPSKECRFYNRLLDVPMRRGGALLPDVRRHLTVCSYCRFAAEQLALCDESLDVLLAETVLGWGARRYLDSRPGRDGAGDWPHPAPPARPEAGGRHRTAAASRHRTVLAVGVGLTALALLATVLVVRSWSDDNGVPHPGATWGAPVGRSTGTGARIAPSPSAAAAGTPVALARGGLYNLASGRCLDMTGGRPVEGAGVRLAACSAAASQQWSYQDDGLLRSAADPALCLAADTGTKNVAVSDCVTPAGEVSYDVTVRGEILLRGHHPALVLAVSSGGGSGRVRLAARDGAAGERWTLAPRPDGVPPAGAAPGEPGPPGAPGGTDEPGAGRPGRAKEKGGGGLSEGPPGRGASRGNPGAGPGRGLREGRSGDAPRIAQVRVRGDRRPSGPGDSGDPGASGSPGGSGDPGCLGHPGDVVRDVVRPVAGGVVSVPATVGTPLG
ncbi:ricin-type beta-trefoil lectin domain protein [Streptomyces sp. NPDC051133]|uniref:ricin-type beta-trefoil lectin domain protein n=1 Tax=Streptomyces sp. NPDC051133 TaxID=3155521 RepID=UPI00341BF78A